MRCLSCHYDLKNLPGPPHRCPECGRAFDPTDPKSFESGVGHKIISNVLLLLGLSIGVIVVNVFVAKRWIVPWVIQHPNVARALPYVANGLVLGYITFVLARFLISKASKRK